MTWHQGFPDGVTVAGGTTGDTLLAFIETILWSHWWHGAVAWGAAPPTHTQGSNKLNESDISP
jgi:outer membrane usher protein FimD/PapC